jgi:acyl carrier protein
VLTKAERPTEAAVLDAVRQAFAVVLEVAPADIGRHSSFAELNADSLVLVEVAEILEERFAPALTLPDSELEKLQTVGDAVELTLARL